MFTQNFIDSDIRVENNENFICYNFFVYLIVGYLL